MDDISILGRSGVLAERISEYLSSRIRQIETHCQSLRARSHNRGPIEHI